VWLLDAALPSEFTLRDNQYWDRLHFSIKFADRLAELVAGAYKGAPESGEIRILHSPKAGR
jgi:hypothetical protein